MTELLSIDNLQLAVLAFSAVMLGTFLATSDDPEIPAKPMSQSSALFYPIMAAIELTALNLFMEYFGPDSVNKVLILYFGGAGTTSVWIMLRIFIRIRGPKLFTYPKSHSIVTEFVFPSKEVDFCLFDIFLWIPALCLNILYFKMPMNLINNVIAFCISVFGILSMRVVNFKAAMPMLWGLIIYDGFFVYNTDMMSNVAMNIDGPIKMKVSTPYGSSLLGLGDIVLPALFISVAARFSVRMKKATGRFSPYWLIAMIGYVAGLIATDIQCAITQQGQPALVYIVPLVTFPAIITALIRREYYAFFIFSSN